MTVSNAPLCYASIQKKNYLLFFFVKKSASCIKTKNMENDNTYDDDRITVTDITTSDVKRVLTLDRTRNAYIPACDCKGKKNILDGCGGKCRINCIYLKVYRIAVKAKALSLRGRFARKRTRENCELLYEQVQCAAKRVAIDCDLCQERIGFLGTICDLHCCTRLCLDCSLKTPYCIACNEPALITTMQYRKKLARKRRRIC